MRPHDVFGLGGQPSVATTAPTVVIDAREHLNRSCRWEVEEYPEKDELGPEPFGQPHQTRPSRSKNRTPPGKRAARRRRRKELAKRQEKAMKHKPTPQLVLVRCTDPAGVSRQAIYRDGKLVGVAPTGQAVHAPTFEGELLMELRTRPEWYGAPSAARFRFPWNLDQVRVGYEVPADARRPQAAS